jgi:hypothetical protein
MIVEKCHWVQILSPYFFPAETKCVLREMSQFSWQLHKAEGVK